MKDMKPVTFLPKWIVALCAIACSASVFAQTPEWIWFQKTSSAETRFFRKTFEIENKATKAELTATGDDAVEVFINGESILTATDWHNGVTAEVSAKLHGGPNTIAIRGVNGDGSPAGAIAQLVITTDKGKTTIVTDASWKASGKEEKDWAKLSFNDNSWGNASSLGKIGMSPWGNVFATTAKAGKPAAIVTKGQATPAETLTVLPGFKVELLRSAEPGEGSWVSMTVDTKGRLIISPQGNEPLLRVTLSESGQISNIEKIGLPVGSAMGMLYAFDSLYLSGRGPDGLALYRLRDTDGDDKLDKIEMLRKFDGAGGEHGSHGIVLGPDNKLYYVHGNFVKQAKDLSPNSQHKNYAEDQLLPRANDGNGFGNGNPPPGGFVVRMDPDGKNCELFASGFRNTYDIAFNTEGELFGFDSDMEWDWGMPWYRPIRVNHIVSGADYGFREGSGKWPEYYQDSLPATLNIGIGSPTGVKFGTGSKFPAKYQRAFFMMDWTYGRLFAVHLQPKGSTYSATAEVLVHGKPLNLTDFEFGKDGAMYFATGGRGTQSGLYRVTYVGKESTAPVLAKENPTAIEARALRHKIEAFHGHQDLKAVDFVWPHLNSEDRWIRYAARIALESQPVAEWKDRALAEEKPNAGLTALLALARLGGKETQKDLLLAMKKFPLDKLTEEQQLIKLRAIELSFIRQGHPEPELAKMAVEKLDAHYPAKSEWLNRELCQLLIYLEAPDAVAKTLKLLAIAPTQEEQIYYLFRLRTAKNWTLDQRRQYFTFLGQKLAAVQNTKYFEPDYPGTRPAPMPISNEHADYVLRWFSDAERPYGDGASFPKFLANMKKDAVESLSPEERAQLAPMLAAPVEGVRKIEARKFVKDWKMADLQPALDEVSHGRNFERGQEMFAAAQCAACHRFGNTGGAVGPDLTAVSSRFTRRDVLESIIDPSKVVSEQYQNMTLYLKDGDDITGRVIEENDDRAVVVTDALTQTKVEVKKANIKNRVASKISPMPEGLVSVLTKDEILDLLAFLESGGNKNHADFKK